MFLQKEKAPKPFTQAPVTNYRIFTSAHAGGISSR